MSVLTFVSQRSSSLPALRFTSFAVKKLSLKVPILLHIKHLQVVATLGFSSGVALCCIRFVYVEDGNVIARVLDLVLTQTQVAVLLRKVSKDVELQEDRNVFAQLMMVSKSLPEIDIREAIGRHQFSVIPRSLVCK